MDQYVAALYWTTTSLSTVAMGILGLYKSGAVVSIFECGLYFFSFTVSFLSVSIVWTPRSLYWQLQKNRC